MSNRDRIYINKGYRTFLDEMGKNNTLGFNLINKKDIFILAVALGLDTPKNFSAAKDGYFLLKDVKSFDRAYFASILLGALTDEKDVDKYANDDVNYDQAEKCAESGFEILKDKVTSAGGDEELLINRLLSELDLLYEKNVSNN